MSRRTTLYLLILLSIGSLGLSGCASSMLSKEVKKNVHEQLYIDAQHNFSVQHPLAWQLKRIPVSSPEYRDDTVRWQINSPQKTAPDSAEMLIRYLPADTRIKLSELLASYLVTKPGFKAGQPEEQNLPTGAAVKLQSQNKNRECLTFALEGQAYDFIISLDYPVSRREELLPIFQKTVNSFREL